ncbi:MAG: formimidoylglutamate deiminase [Proteobacteria bacterium]|nr:formimidoylglutamate deiminase [Pseudomonadota bacterium]MCP4920872.1 formimidoylglutamate deiminase [Pseudomonadota bacterium]
MTTPQRADHSRRIVRPQRVLVDGALTEGLEIHVEAGRIASIVPADGPMTHPGKALLPGFVNAHSHAFQRGLRGHVQWSKGEDTFWSWRDRMYRLANQLDADGIEAVSALAFLEMAEAGFTSVGEFHYLHHLPEGTAYGDREELAHRVVRAARRVGLRINLLRVAYQRAGPDKDRTREQRRFCDDRPEQVLDAIRRLRAAHQDDPAVSVGLAPHSVRAVPRAWLEAFSDFDGRIHAHVSEQPAENDQCRAEHGMSPTALFAEVGLLDERFTAVHMTFPQSGDAELMRERGSGVCACPTTELDLGDGFLPIDHLAGIPLSIGTDSHAQIDPFAEVRALELHARGLQGRRNVLSSEDPDGLANRLLDVGTVGGAAALGLDAGRMSVGQLADFVIIDLEHTLLAGSRPLPAIALAAHPGVVSETWVGGQPVCPDRGAIVDAAVRALADVDWGPK